MTALMIAKEKELGEIVEELIKRGADPNSMETDIKEKIKDGHC